MDSSVATMARTSLCTIRRSWAMGTEPYRREMQSNLRSFKAPRVRKPLTSRKTAAAKDLQHQDYETGRQCSALLPAVFLDGEDKEERGLVSFRAAHHTPSGVKACLACLVSASALRRLIPIGRSLVAEAPHVCCDRRSLVGGKLRAPIWRHRAAILLWL